MTENFLDLSRHVPVTAPLMRLVLRSLVRGFAPRWRVTGRHNIIHRGPVLFVPNHTSDVDPALIYASVRRHLWYMAKSELFNEWPSLVPFLRYALAFPVEPDSADRQALHFAEQLLNRGDGLVVFPEGKCSPDGTLQSIQPGAALLALRTGVPVVPVGIRGATSIMPYATIRPRFTLDEVRVHFGKAISFADLADLPRRQQRQQATERLRQAIADVVAVTS